SATPRPPGGRPRWRRRAPVRSVLRLRRRSGLLWSPVPSSPLSFVAAERRSAATGRHPAPGRLPQVCPQAAGKPVGDQWILDPPAPRRPLGRPTPGLLYSTPLG